MLGSKQNLLWVWKHLNTSRVCLRLWCFDSVQCVSWRYFMPCTPSWLPQLCCLTNSLGCHEHGKNSSCLPQDPLLSPFLLFAGVFFGGELNPQCEQIHTKKKKRKKGLSMEQPLWGPRWLILLQSPSCGMKWPWLWVPKCDRSRGQLCLQLQQRIWQASGCGTQAVTGIPYAASHIPDDVREWEALCLSPLCPAAPPLVPLTGKDVSACTQGMSVQELYFLHVKKRNPLVFLRSCWALEYPLDSAARI